MHNVFPCLPNFPHFPSSIATHASALCYEENGTFKEAAYFKQRSIYNNAIVVGADAAQSQAGQENIMVNVDWLPPDVKFVFILLTLRSGATCIAETGAGIQWVARRNTFSCKEKHNVRFCSASGSALCSVADGSQPNGRFLRDLPLNHVTTSAYLAAVLIRPPSHMYPPSWALQVCQSNFNFILSAVSEKR